MIQRTITALLILALAIPALWFGGVALDVVIMALVIIGFFEMMTMTKIQSTSPESLIGLVATLALSVPTHYYSHTRLTPLLVLGVCACLLLIIMVFSKNVFSFEKVGTICLVALYIGLGSHYVLEIRSQGFWEVLFMLSVCWGTDTAAYLVGVNFGKHRLAPHISPNKSIEGSLGGVIVVSLCALFWSLWQQPFQLDTLGLMMLTIVISLAGQLGDLVESAIKRFYHVKDSGDILPGHGGVLDRCDSALFGAVACYLMLNILK